MNRHPLYWATLPAHETADRRAAMLRLTVHVLIVVAVFAAIIAGICGCAYTLRYLS